VVGGNPAALIRSRFDEATVKKLLKINWWDCEIEKITKNTLKNFGTGAALTREFREDRIQLDWVTKF